MADDTRDSICKNHTALVNCHAHYNPEIEPIGGAVGSCNKRLDNSKRKTKTLKNSVHPVFEETLDYFVPSASDLKLRRLEISVCSDGGVLGRNVVLAHCIVSLRGLHDAIMGTVADKKYLGESPSVDFTDWHTLTAPKTTMSQDSINTPKVNKRYMERSKSFAGPLRSTNANANAHLPICMTKEMQYDSKRSL